MKKSIAERKLRTAANTNNTDLVEQILSSQGPDVNSQDELKRSALHFASAKVGTILDGTIGKVVVKFQAYSLP